MDVIINYGINYKKCKQISYSGYNRKSLLSHLLHNIVNKNSEVSHALIAELHCSSYYKDIENFFINFLSQYIILSDISLSFFINKYFEKINNIKKTIPKSQQNNGLINSNEIRNIYTSIISKFLLSKYYLFTSKINSKSHHPENYLIHSNLSTFYPIIDSQNKELNTLLSRGIREILFFNETHSFDLSKSNLEKINYWILWTNKINKNEKNIFTSNNKYLKKMITKKHNKNWEYFIWDKIWHKCEKNNFINKNLIKSMMKLFYYNYNHSKLKDRTGILGAAVLISNTNIKIPINKIITSDEIFSNLNSNIIYKNITTSENNNENYAILYNNYYNIQNKDTDKHKKAYTDNKMATKMDILTNYHPKMIIDENKISDYFR